MTHIVGFIDSFPFWLGILILIAFFLLQVPIITFPIYVLLFYSGLIYGFKLGFIIAYIGMFLCSWMGYEMGYYGLGSAQKLLEHHKFETFREWFDKNGIKAIIFFRIVSIVPYNANSIGSGLMKVQRGTFLAVNAPILAIYPLIWAYIGDRFGSILTERLHFEFSYELLIPTVIIVFLFGILYVYLKQSIVKDKDFTEEIAL